MGLGRRERGISAFLVFSFFVIDSGDVLCVFPGLQHY